TAAAPQPAPAAPLASAAAPARAPAPAPWPAVTPAVAPTPASAAAPPPAAASSSAAAPAPAAAPARSPAPQAVDERIMDLVVEKTGYPRDMLDLDLDLEADLGIDTVKQAEMFASIREMYNIPRDANVKLRDFSTLARVIGFVYDRRP